MHSWLVRLAIVTSLFGGFCLNTDVGRAEPRSTKVGRTWSDDATRVDAVGAATTDPPALTSFHLPPETDVHRQVVGLDGTQVVSAAGDEKLVYSNTQGKDVLSLANGTYVADDLTLLAVFGCTLRQYGFQVVGKADPKSFQGGDYRVDYAIYDRCPGAGGKVVDGTQGFITFSERTNGPGFDTVIQEVLVTPAVAVTLNSTVWLALKASRDNVGVIIGAPPLVGFSADWLDWPTIACNANVGGFPDQPHASFNATVYVDPACAAAYPAYRNLQPARGGFTEGTNRCIADDLELNVDACSMVAYEVHVRGTGVYKFELRRDAGGLPGAVIPGTVKTRAVPSTVMGAQTLRFPIDPPIALPPKVWLTFQGNNPGAGWVLTRKDAEIGTTARTYAHSISGASCTDVDDWATLNLNVLTGYGGFDATITCAGLPPTGACCDMFVLDEAGEAVCRDVPRMNCPMANALPQVQWVAGADCESELFPHGCGLSACCKPDETCENLTQNQCAAHFPPTDFVTWQRLEFCDELEQKCPFYHCVQPQSGHCSRAQAGPGCQNSACCQAVSDADPWCARVEWDRVCLRETVATLPCESISPTFPPNNDCEPSEGTTESSALLLEPNTSVVFLNDADSDPTDPGFSCHNGFPPHCQGGDFDGIPCAEELDCLCPPDWFGCISGTCVPQAPIPDQQGFYTLWFRFVATNPSARISTCNADPAADATIIAVFRPEDPSPDRACATLSPLACNDDSPTCGTGLGSELCVDGLVPGETYYIQLANTWYGNLGVIQLDLESPCPDPKPNDSAREVTTIAASAASMRSPISDDKADRGVASTPDGTEFSNRRSLHREVPNDPPRARPASPPPGVLFRSTSQWEYEGYVSVQVNVDSEGNNIPGDAANEPSIAVDPTDPNHLAIGWRQFDSVESDFRQAGWGYSQNGGQSWTFPGSLTPGVFGTDPVLDSGPDGTFYYLSINFDEWRLFRSYDGGATWPDPVRVLTGFEDKPWMAVDRTEQVSRGNVYCAAFGTLWRSYDDGESFRSSPMTTDIFAGTMAVGPNGAIHVTGGHVAAGSNPLRNRSAPPVFRPPTGPRWDAGAVGFVEVSPNPGGLLQQGWVAVDTSATWHGANVYLLAGTGFEIFFSRSRDGGKTWDAPVRISDAPPEGAPYDYAWNWFGTMSVSPSGRIDVVWNHSLHQGPPSRITQLRYSYSANAGRTWSPSVAVGPIFDSRVGWPRQAKIGDYYHARSDDRGMMLAYAATYNGEQDIYFLRIPPTMDCNNNGTLDAVDLANGTSPDCTGNGVPDECEPDFDGDGIVDSCDDDVDNDGVPNSTDDCLFTAPDIRVDATGRPAADTNKNCELDLSDYWRFRNCMLNGRLGAPAPREACLAAFDANSKGRIELADFSDFMNSFGD